MTAHERPNGGVDPADSVCIILCLAGAPPQGADCECATDCNCSGDVNAADPICAVLRVIGSFTPDTCE